MKGKMEGEKEGKKIWKNKNRMEKTERPVENSKGPT
jgi:hypothetical protein